MRQAARLFLIGILSVILGMTAIACGSGDGESVRLYDPDNLVDTFALDATDSAAWSRSRLEVQGVQGAPGAPGLPGATATPAPAPTPAAAMAARPARGDLLESISESEQPQTQLVTDRRIIIREVDMDLVVEDIQVAIDRIADIAVDAGGWVVDSSRYSLHRGGVSIRVPAELLDAAIDDLRRMARKVQVEQTSSRDVTDEYVDLEARLRNEQVAEAALLALLERADSVEAALDVRRDLRIVQGEIESISGRIKFLEETSAFSLIRVTLSLAAVELAVDAGPDKTAAVRTPVRFNATFRPPDGIEDYIITWDFGDGSHPVIVNRTAATQDEGQLVTATVVHSYDDLRGSPFIAHVNITGTGEGGVVEGEDTLTVSVSEVPVIEVFAGERQIIVDQNTKVEFQGSFTRPSSLTNVRYAWDFGDGSPLVEGNLAEGVTVAAASHAYANHRREPYTARLTVKADSGVGEVTAEDTVHVFVREGLGLVAGEYGLGATAKDAVRGLTSFGEHLFNVLVWVAIFSPLWGAVAVVAWLFGPRLGRRITNRRDRTTTTASAQQAGTEDAG